MQQEFNSPLGASLPYSWKAGGSVSVWLGGGGRGWGLVLNRQLYSHCALVFYQQFFTEPLNLTLKPL